MPKVLTASQDYFAYLGPDGRRLDIDSRPELRYGSVDMIASSEFLVRPPMPPAFFYLIDVSSSAVASGATSAACSALRRLLADLPPGDRTLFGLATFDTAVHFYNLTPGLPQVCALPYTSSTASLNCFLVVYNRKLVCAC